MVLTAISEPVTLAIGEPGPPFEDLLGADGRRHGFSSLADRRLLVLVFSSNRCPTAKAYAARLNDLEREGRSRGIGVVAINANDPHLYPDESYPRMRDQATRDGYTFPYLMDEGQRVARAYGPTCTFHVFLLDEARRLRYQGRFDDARLPERVQRRDLGEAIEAVLAGRPVEVPVTRAFGCAMDYVERS